VTETGFRRLMVVRSKELTPTADDSVLHMRSLHQPVLAQQLQIHD
jgi:hypothetical protein